MLGLRLSSRRITTKRKKGRGFQILVNVFFLKFGQSNIYYIQNFLFPLSFLSLVWWLLVSGRFTSNAVELDFFVVGLNYLVLMTVLSRWLPISAKKPIVCVNFFVGFMTMVEWLNYDLISVQVFPILLIYVMVAAWSYGLAQNMATDPSSYRLTLIGLVPLSVFGFSLMFLGDPLLFLFPLLVYIFSLAILKTYAFRYLNQFMSHLPEFPFFLPEYKQKSFFDIFHIPKSYSVTLLHNKDKPKITLAVEHLMWLCCSPVILFPLISLLDLREAEENFVKDKIMQQIKESPPPGMTTPNEVSRQTKKDIEVVARYLDDLVQSRELQKFSGKSTVFVNPDHVDEDDLRILEFSEKLLNVSREQLHSELKRILYALAFSFSVDSTQKLMEITGRDQKEVEKLLLELERKGSIRQSVFDNEFEDIKSLEETLQRARQKYESVSRTTSDMVLAVLDKNPETEDLNEETKVTLAMMVTKALLANSDPFEKEFVEISEKTDILFMNATDLKHTITSYQIPIKMQKNVVETIFVYVRDKIKIRIEEPFGEKVRWPWTTWKTGGDCDCKTILLASMLYHLGFEGSMAVIPPIYVPSSRTTVSPHSFVIVHLRDPATLAERKIDLDPSDQRCGVGEVSAPYRAYRQHALSVDLSSIAYVIGLQGI